MDAPQLQRLVLDYRRGELIIRVLYRSQDGPGPGTKARRREENRQAWASFHEGQAACYRRTLEGLINYHQMQAERLLAEG